jgi:hypothetical protein
VKRQSHKRATPKKEGLSNGPKEQPDELVRLQPLPLGDEATKTMNTAIR